MDTALEHYARAGDYLSLVRLHCYLGDLNRATELAEQSQDRAACFHVARQHEANNNIPEALKFFGQAAAYGNAVRLCKVNFRLSILEKGRINNNSKIGARTGRPVVPVRHARRSRRND